MASVIDAPAVGDAVRRHGNGTVDIELDRVLVARAQSGDSAAFAELYEHYHRRLFVVCLRRLADRHEAEDVVQESFARAWRSLSGFDGERRFYPWLSVIASHLCTDILRRRGRAVPVADLQAGNVVSAEESGEDRVLAQCERAEVAAALSRLNQRHRRVLALREEHQWSYQQIAELEGIALSAVETLLWRARRALERAMAEAEKIGQLALVVGLGSVAALARRGRRLIRCRAGGWGPRVPPSMVPLRSGSRHHRSSWRALLASWTRRIVVAGAQWTGGQGPSGGQMAAFGAVAVSVAVSLALIGSAGFRSQRPSASPPASPRTPSLVSEGGVLPAFGSSTVAPQRAAGSMLRGSGIPGAFVVPLDGAGASGLHSVGTDAGGASGAARGVLSSVTGTSRALLDGLLVHPAPGTVPGVSSGSGTASAGTAPTTLEPAGPVLLGNEGSESGASTPIEAIGAGRSAPTAGSTPAQGSTLAPGSEQSAATTSTAATVPGSAAATPSGA